MSINFKSPANAESLALIEAYFGKPTAADDKTLLFDEMPVIDRSQMNRVANAAGQPVTTEFDRQGTIKLLDNVPWILTENGWQLHRATGSEHATGGSGSAVIGEPSAASAETRDGASPERPDETSTPPTR